MSPGKFTPKNKNNKYIVFGVREAWAQILNPSFYMFDWDRLSKASKLVF